MFDTRHSAAHTAIGLALVICLLVAAAPALAGNVLHVPRHFTTIQEAIDAATHGDIIRVARGTYTENVAILGRTGLRLRGSNATLVGTGSGIGILVAGSSHIEVQGFTVEGYEAGIVLDATTNSDVHNIETRFNDSDDSTLRDGLQLVASHRNRVSNVYAHDNGHNGITLKLGSTGNTIRVTTNNDNGQNPAVAASIGGCGIQLIGAGNDDNRIAANTARRNGWGIQIGGGSNGNHVVHNRSHGNKRAGIVVLDPGSDNFIGQNGATGNGLAGVAPSGSFDLFDQGALDNIWRNNRGSANF